MKTNATRILDSMGIRYQLVEYQVDPNDLSAETVARKVGLPSADYLRAANAGVGPIARDKL
jgi:prolyl-tRNA editing enzyme YbaK/EbsC (Cys-tRNA(Pro) deacylase)